MERRALIFHFFSIQPYKSMRTEVNTEIVRPQ